MTTEPYWNDCISRQFDELARMHREPIALQTGKYVPPGDDRDRLYAELLKDFSGIPYAPLFYFVDSHTTPISVNGAGIKSFM